MKTTEYLQLSGEEIKAIINRGGEELDELGKAVETYVYKIALTCGLSDYVFDTIGNLTTRDFVDVFGGAKGKAEIELRVSQKFYFDKTVVNDWGEVFGVDVAVGCMDNELMEEIYWDLSPCTEQEFFNEYAKRHAKKFNEEWELAKENPVF